MGLGLYLLILGLRVLQPVKTASSECGVGWETNGDKCIDVDECAYPVCGNHAICFNTNGSYYCQCNPGFHVNSESRTFTGTDGRCRDINECLETPNICGPKASCQNTAGSYICTCSEGYISSLGQRVFHNATGVTCEGLRDLQPVKTASSECGIGWETNGDKCIDVDECAYPVCGNRAICFNTNGSYYCQCNPGFHVNSESRTFTGTDGRCRDINECLETPNICGPKASCQNTAGSYICTCSEGYISSNGQRVFHNATGVTCEGLRDLQPVKTASFECGIGWETNGDKCIDVDECAYPVCGNHAICFNTNGSYYCQCNPGFHVNSESRTFTGIDGRCRDINECLETPKICGPKASCQNTAGSYNCTCSEGYISSLGQRVFHNATGVTCEELKSDLYKTSGSPDQDTFQLQVITWVGLSVLLMCLLLCIVTFPFCQSIQGTLNFIHIHLCICLFIADLVFLAGISRTEDKVGCGIVAGVLHYFFLAAFCWTLLLGVQLYCMVVLVFNATLRPIVTITIGYVVPAVIVAASAQGYGTDRHCWLNLENGFIWRFFVPVCIIIIINGMFFIVTVWKLAQKFYCLNPDMCTLRKIKMFTVTAIAQLCVLGTMWISGCFQFEGSTLVASYLFSIFNCLQGALVLIMRCLLYKQVREKHARFLPCIRKDLSANESSSEPVQAFRTLESN